MTKRSRLQLESKDCRAYDTLNRLTTIGSAKDGNTIFRASYTLDNAGMRTKVEETDRTVNYTYDTLYRLLSENDGTNATSYTYDNNGNQLTETQQVTIKGLLTNLVTTNTYDAENRLLSTTDPEGRTTRTEYDKNGKEIANYDALASLRSFSSS